MPYYYWRGVELSGGIKKGRLFARSLDHLDQLLFKREIALIASKPLRQWFTRPIFLTQKVELFKRLAVLIDAGVHVPEALALVADQLDHPQLQEKIHDLARRVTEGDSLSNAMKQYPDLFSLIMIQLVCAGEESGSLAQALDGICNHLTITQDFYNKLRSALMLPMITVLFFFAIVLIIFTVIMPRFVEIFSSFNQELPAVTQQLLAISTFILSGGMVTLLIAMGIGASCVYKLMQGRLRFVKEFALLHTPVIGTIIQNRFLAHALQSIALLVDGGIPLVQAVILIREATTHTIFLQQLLYIEQDIQTGSSLSDAMSRHPQEIFSPDSVAMIAVAEESGRLALLLKKTALSYHDQVIKKLTLLTLVLQPIIMIILGLLVATLVYAVYGPIMNMSAAF